MAKQIDTTEYASQYLDVDFTTKRGKSHHYNKIESSLRRSTAVVQCHWRLNAQRSSVDSTASSCEDVRVPVCTFDILFTTVSISHRPKILGPLPEAEIHIVTSKVDAGVSGQANISWTKPDNEKSKAHLFLQNAIMMNVDQNGSQITAMKLLLPAVDGYVVRNDLIQRRFLNYDLAERLSDFTSPRQHVRRFVTSSENLLEKAVNDALGAVLLKGLPGVQPALLESAMSLLEFEVMARLSFPWIVSIPIPRRRLAIVEGRSDPSVSAASEGVLRAAAALDIGLVILDQEGHWLQSATNEHLRDEFLVCDLSVDDELPSRIVDALSRSRRAIDGITTYSDRHLIATAKVAQMLGFCTNLPDSIEMCNDKRRMREVVTPQVATLFTTGLADLKEQLKSFQFPLQYPMIVKPTQGSSSEGVNKVHSRVDLLAAVENNQKQFPERSFLIEPYVPGPEVDANFVLLDGQILFNETNDDFPSSAEIPHTSLSPSFAEMSTIMPSNLPEPELSLLKSSLTETLAKLGCRYGVYHVEARVKDSRKEYRMTENGLELMHRQSNTTWHPDPSIFLIEINARTPGHQESFATELTYGIDYYALYMLLAIVRRPSADRSGHQRIENEANSDSELTRLYALSHSFPAHIRYPTNIVFIPVARNGTFVSAKPLSQELMKFIPHFRILMKKGQVIQDPKMAGKWPFIAYFLVTAKLVGKDGRAQARTLGERVRESFEYELI